MKPERQQGATVVEFALVLPVLLLLVFGIAQFGWLMNNYIVLTNAAAAGARLLASERGYSTPYTDTKTAVLAATSALNNTPTITMTVGTTTCTSDATCITALGTSSQPPTSGTRATVSLSYTFVPPFKGSLYNLKAMMPSTLSANTSVVVQ